VFRRLRRRQRPVEQSDRGRLDSLERQVANLEELVEGLQDAVHRESTRRAHEVSELKRQMAPPELARALSEHARKRGLD
jgi:hypothetical protein